MANGNVNPMQQNEGMLLKPAMDTAQKAAKAGRVKSIKLKIKMKDKQK